jgi:putative hydrolase of the HAD superfamily
MIKVICFDLGKVIVDFDYAVAIRELMKATSLSLAEVTAVLSNNSFINEYETGKISTVEFFRLVSHRLRLEVPLETFKQLWGNMFLPQPLLSESFLQSLKKRYRLILLSNTNEIHFEFVEERYPILGHIEERVLSYQVGCMKPDEKIYHTAVAKADVAPEEILFTDDRQENIDAARAIGIQAIQFQSEGQLKRDMKLLGVLS